MTDRTENLKQAISSIEALKSYYDSKAKPRRPLKAIRWALCVAKECMEKQIPKKLNDNIERLREAGFYGCPNCETPILNGMKYCCVCGQKLDWEEGGTSD